MDPRLLHLKAKAFGIHFGISLGIFLILLYWVVFHWYPPPFFHTDGGWQGVRLIVLVDLVLGPMLTLVVYNPIKKSTRHLKMDLTLIALCQLAALVWGTWVVQNERPYLVVFSDRTFYSLPYYQIAETGLHPSDLAKFGATAPIKIFTDIPDAAEERLKIFTEAMTKNQPVHFLSEYYQPFGENSRGKLLSSSIDMEVFLRDQDAASRDKYQQFATRHAERLEQLLFFPLRARYGRFIAVLDQHTLEFVGVLDIEPPVVAEWKGRDAYQEEQERQP